MAGWVRLYRKSAKSRVWANDGLWKTWCWCLLRANHGEQVVSVKTGRGTTEVKVGPGQFVYGRKSAAKALKVDTSTARNRMAKLKKLGNLDIQADTHYSIVTICKWQTYQQRPEKKDRQEDRHRTTKGQPKDNQEDTDKNVSKECLKNDKEKKAAAPLPLLPEELLSLADLWQAWIEHRRDKRTKLTARAAELQIADMRAMGVERSAAALRHSIKNNYTGLYEPKENGSHTAHNRPKLGSRR